MSVAVLAPPSRHTGHQSVRSHQFYRIRRLRALSNARWRERRRHGEVFFLDAEPVRDHIRGLMATYRMPINAIVAQTGVPRGTLVRVLYDRKTPVTRVVADIGNRLLGAHFSLDVIADHAVINPIGTRRRLQGLAVAGYGLTVLAGELNRSPGKLQQATTRITVRADFARAVRDLADRLEIVPPPGDPGLIAATQGDAERRGWVPLAAWDDIDDPAATPSMPSRPDTEPDFAVVEQVLFGVPSTRGIREIDIYEAILCLRDRGKGATVLAQLINCNGSRARRLVERATLYELMRRLDAEGRLELRFLNHVDSGTVHVIRPVDPDDEGQPVSWAEGLTALALDPIPTLCGYQGRPGARGGASRIDEFIDRFNDDRLCRSCHRALRLLAPRAFEHPQGEAP